MTILTNKTILITGAAGGFGQEFARQLHQKGNQLILTDLNEDHLEEQAGTLAAGQGSGRVTGIVAGDLSTADGADALFERVSALDGPVDVLINNAGIGMLGRHDEVPTAAWERLMQINLLAPMRLSALFAPQMIARGSGHIVNISSIAGWTAEVGLSAYSASKFGLRGFSESLAEELGGYGIRVSAVYPFFSRTPILNSPRFGTLGEMNPMEETEIRGITEPADVVAESIQGIERDALHIFPDRTARVAHRLKRYAPGLLKRLQQWMVAANR